MKRAKGLVKNGRARFINENTICLACPPKEYLEDNKMENKSENKTEVKLTEREIFEQIVALQKQLTENNANSLHRLSDVIDSIYSTESETGNKQVSEACTVFIMREKNLEKMLDFYLKMYDDVRKTDEERKADVIKTAFSELSLNINKLDLRPQDKFPALAEIIKATEKLVKSLISDK